LTHELKTANADTTRYRDELSSAIQKQELLISANQRVETVAKMELDEKKELLSINQSLVTAVAAMGASILRVSCQYHSLPPLEVLEDREWHLGNISIVFDPY
jgi:hypothetical protein